MNILVFLKIVSRQQFADSLEDGAERLASGRIMLSPADLYALELALRVKDRDPDTTVTAVTMAPRACETELRQTLAMGADSAVLLSDRRLAGSDTLATARALAALVRSLPPQDLLICGRKSTDSETGHIGPQLALLLGIPMASGVTGFSEENGLTVTCMRDGSVRTYQREAPALITVCYGAGTVRCPTIAGLRRSRKSEVKLLDIDDIGLSTGEAGAEGSPTRVVKTEEYKFGAREGIMTDDPMEGASKIASAIKKYGGLPV